MKKHAKYALIELCYVLIAWLEGDGRLIDLLASWRQVVTRPDIPEQSIAITLLGEITR